MDIAANLRALHERIDAACGRVARDPKTVRLLAVSKGHDESAIRAAYAAGQRELGENYAQELARKVKALGDLTDLRFRFIGHLQRNKIKDVVGAHAIDAVDSVRLAEALHRHASANATRFEVMLQVNVAGEASKSGCAPSDLAALVREVRSRDALALRGLMTIPPAEGDPRPFFRALRELAAEHGLPELSMGMSDDFEIAIEEGATMVRVGSAIFGPRG